MALAMAFSLVPIMLIIVSLGSSGAGGPVAFAIALAVAALVGFLRAARRMEDDEPLASPDAGGDLISLRAVGPAPVTSGHDHDEHHPPLAA